MIRRLTLLVLALALAAAWPSVARAEDAGGDNTAVAINTRDDTSIFRLAFKISRVAGDIVDNTNAAVAFNQCERCESFAIAVQIVLITGDPNVVTPTNVAVAINQSCNLCTAFASAYQFVVSTGGAVRFTPQGLQEIAQIRRELRALRKVAGDLSVFELQERVGALMQRLRTVLRTQLVPAGRAEDAQGDEAEVEEGEDALEPEDTPTAPATVADEDAETVPTTTSTETTPTTTETGATTTTETTTTTP